jgi:hypothetical protein
MKINVEEGWFKGVGDICAYAWLCAGITSGGGHPACWASLPWRLEMLRFFDIEVLEERAGCVTPIVGYEVAMHEKSPLNYVEWIAQQCGITDPPQRPIFVPNPMDREMGRAWSTDVLVFPDCIWKPRTWPKNYWMELCLLMTQAGINYKIVTKERDYEWEVYPFKTVHEKNITEVASAIQMANLVIGNDSGPAHLAGTLGVKTIAILGSTTERIYAHIPQVECYRKQALPCAGCHSLGPPFKASCVQGCHELYRTFPEDVFARVMQILGGPEKTNQQMNIEKRRCCDCDILKGLDEFYHDKNDRLNRRRICKKCDRKRADLWHSANKERYRDIWTKCSRKRGVLEVKERALLRRGPQHHNSKDWHLRDPRGREHHFVDLLHFVRSNPDLFNPEDVEWRPKKPGSLTQTCRADGGLKSLSPRRKHNRLSWKGWTWVSIYEQRVGTVVASHQLQPA